MVFKESRTKAVQNSSIKKLIAGNSHSKSNLVYSLHLPLLKPWLDAFFEIESEPRYTEQCFGSREHFPAHRGVPPSATACLHADMHLDGIWESRRETFPCRAGQAVPHHPSHTAGTAGCSAPTASCAGSWCGRTPAAGRPKSKQETWWSFVVLSSWFCRLGQGWGCKPVLRAPW